MWENRELDGRLDDTPSSVASGEWINFGGDKCWPAPQSAWPERQGRAWPPPAAFDARPGQCVAVDGGVSLISPVDEDYGIQCVRRVELDPRLPVMRIRTEFHKICGSALRAAVWTITQMKDPECISLLLPAESGFADGYIRLIESEPKGLRREGRMLRLARHPGAHVKIGTESCSLLWVGAHEVLRIDTERCPGEYPDGGCVTEAYTSPDPLAYVELETMSPMAEMKAGDCISHATVYTLMLRSAVDAETETRKIFG